MSATDWTRQGAPAPARLPAEELATLIQRAEAMGVPAWRVTTALGIALPPGEPSGQPPAPR